MAEGVSSASCLNLHVMISVSRVFSVSAISDGMLRNLLLAYRSNVLGFDMDMPVET